MCLTMKFEFESLDQLNAVFFFLQGLSNSRPTVPSSLPLYVQHSNRQVSYSGINFF